MDQAAAGDVAFLVVGDPFGATTHSDLQMRAIHRSVPYSVVHNASIMNSVAECGLQLYCFGPTVSIPFFTERWRPDSFYGKIAANRAAGAHTLCLLDIKVKEQSEENMLRERKIYEPPRYMTVGQAMDQLAEVEASRALDVIRPDTIVVGVARLGSPTQLIAAGRFEVVRQVDFGAPLHCLVVVGKLHECEEELLLARYCVDEKAAFLEAVLKNHK